MSALPDWLIALIVAVFPGFAGPDPVVFSGYVEADYVYAAPVAAGRLTSLSVDEGDEVAQGDTLFTLDDSRQVSALRAAEARIEVAQANLANLETGRREEEIEVIRAELARAEAQLDLAADNLARSEHLLTRGNIATAQVDADRTALASARAQVNELRAQLNVAALPARDAERRAAQATLAAAQADAASAKTALEDRVVAAPAGGVVDRLFYDVGEVAEAGAPVLSILPADALTALFFVPEERRGDLRVGDAVLVTCDTCGGGYSGHVTRLADKPQYTPPVIYSREERGRLVFRAEAALNPGAVLQPGQPVTVRPQP